MKLHKPIAQQVVSALSQTFGEGYHADKVIERLFRHNRQLGSRDRKFIAESVYEIVRWWRLLRAGLGEESAVAAENNLWHLLGAWLLWRGWELPPWPELKGLNPKNIHDRMTSASENPAVRASVPDWLYQTGCEEFGERVWQEILIELNKPAPVVLRANRLKTVRDDLKGRLLDEGIETVYADAGAEAPDALILTQRKNVFTTQAFKAGHFEVQDGASQQVAPLLNAEPGQRVIDACAGAGGKTLHLAAIMRNKGKIIAMDVHEKKLEELKKRAARAGCDIIEARQIENSKTIKRLKESADRVLLDVPCSGIGVLRRNPDSKWKLKPEELVRLRTLQAEILGSYSEMVKVGGRLVYTTCSILPSENEKQVEAFLSQRDGGWRLVTEKKFRPGENGFDGFYAAALERLR